MTPEEIRSLYDYNAWANRRALDAASALTPEQFSKPLGSSFSSVRDTLAHIWRGVDLAGAFSGPLTVFAARHHAIRGRRQPGLALGWTGNAAARFRPRAHANGSRPRSRIQDAQIRRLQKSAVAIHAACRESRHLPSRPGDHHAAPTWRPADPDGPDALLSRARRRRRLVATTPSLWTPSGPSPG